MSHCAIAVPLAIEPTRRRTAGGPQGWGASAQATPLAPSTIPAMAPTAGHEGDQEASVRAVVASGCANDLETSHVVEQERVRVSGLGSPALDGRGAGRAGAAASRTRRKRLAHEGRREGSTGLVTLPGHGIDPIRSLSLTHVIVA